MNINHTHIDDILAKWLAGEATEAELQFLNTWAAENEENQKHVTQFEKLWNHAEDDVFSMNTDVAWQQVMEKTTQPAKPNYLRIAFRVSTGLAACITLFFVARYFSSNKGKISPEITAINTSIFIQSGDQIYNTKLPDGTEISLKPHSSIMADTGFNKNNRIVHLNGSAHFKTVHGLKNVFTVKHGNTEIRDIGTAFTVSTYENKTKVVVTEGKVQFIGKTDSVFLTVGDSAISEKGSSIVVLNSVPKLLPEELKNKVLVFSNTELKKATQIINATYHSDIRIASNAIANCKLNISFENEKLETILELIQDVFNLEIRREGNTIYLNGKGCQ